LPEPDEPMPFAPEVPETPAANGPLGEPAPPVAPPQSSTLRIWRYNTALLQQNTTAK